MVLSLDVPGARCTCISTCEEVMSSTRLIFTDCEINISPNCCVIDGQKPQFLTVSDVLRRNVDHTKAVSYTHLLRRLAPAPSWPWSAFPPTSVPLVA